MERILKDGSERNFANSRRAAQRKPLRPAQSELAGRLDDSPLLTAQRKKLQSLFGGAAQLREETRPNNTGLPDQLKSGVENLSGMSMDGVRVHYNSSLPAQLNALAYAQGSDIHVAPGQEEHLPHEAWHVVQQAQGQVKPTTQMKGGVAVNDDQRLEREADVMGARAARCQEPRSRTPDWPSVPSYSSGVLQARGVTLELMKQAIGGEFNPSVKGRQWSSRDTEVDGVKGVDFHFSVLTDNPGGGHVAYYPAGDSDHERKILQSGYQWDETAEIFRTKGVIREKNQVWKTYISCFSKLTTHANTCINKLQNEVKRLLDAPSTTNVEEGVKVEEIGKPSGNPNAPTPPTSIGNVEGEPERSPENRKRKRGQNKEDDSSDGEGGHVDKKTNVRPEETKDDIN